MNLTESPYNSYIAQNYALSPRYAGFRLIDVKPGQQLVKQGDPIFEIHLLLSGFAHSKHITQKGKEGSTGLYFPSSLLGRDFTNSVEIAENTTEILSPGKVVAIYRPEIEKLMHDPLAVQELAVACRNDSYNWRRLLMVRNQETLFDSVGQLIYMLTKNGETESPKVSQNHLATFISGVRPRICASLGELINSGYVAYAKGSRKSSHQISYSITEAGKDYFSSEFPQ